MNKSLVLAFLSSWDGMRVRERVRVSMRVKER